MNWEKVDKFYFVLIGVLILMATLVVFSFRGIFSAYLSAYELDQGKEAEVRVDKEKLEQAYTWAFNKTTLPLEVRE